MLIHSDKTQNALADAFAGVDLWIFDLDNTLYPYPPGLWAQIDGRMGSFISDLLSVDRIEARRVQKDYFLRYGLTVRGLMKHHGVKGRDFLDYVHDVDLSDIAPNPPLGEAIATLPGRKVIHTNSDRLHVDRVLARLGIETAVFAAIHDIETTGFEPKPAPRAYDAVAKIEGGAPHRAAMFEDSARNLLEPHKRGMRTVLLPTQCDIASAGKEGAHIHFATNDLTGFLRSITDTMA